jgi:hypothetical protein
MSLGYLRVEKFIRWELHCAAKPSPKQTKFLPKTTDFAQFRHVWTCKRMIDECATGMALRYSSAGGAATS